MSHPPASQLSSPAMTQPACEWVWVLSGGGVRIHRTLHHALYMYEHHMEHQERNSRVRISLVKPRHPPAGIMIIMTTVLCTRKQTHRDDGWVPGRVSRVNEDLKHPASDVVDAKHATHVHAHCHVSEQKADVRRFGTWSLRSPRAGTAPPRVMLPRLRAAFVIRGCARRVLKTGN